MVAGLTCSHNLISSHIEEGAHQWVKDEFPELMDLAFISQWRDEGVPIPRITLEMEMETKKGKMIDKNGNLKREYPEGTRVFMDDLDFDEDDLFKGYIFNINHETPLDITVSRDLLISEGMGSFIKFYK